MVHLALGVSLISTPSTHMHRIARRLVYSCKQANVSFVSRHSSCSFLTLRSTLGIHCRSWTGGTRCHRVGKQLGSQLSPAAGHRSSFLFLWCRGAAKELAVKAHSAKRSTNSPRQKGQHRQDRYSRYMSVCHCMCTTAVCNTNAVLRNPDIR